MDNTRKIAQQIIAYLGERARGGVPMDFSANFFEACICAGMENIFGIEWQGDRLARDWHEPEPGFFRTWLARYEMIPGTRLTALTSLPFPGTPLS